MKIDKTEVGGIEIMDHPDAEEVDMGEWLDATRPEKLFTTGLGPCAGVLVHNPKKAKAVLGHFLDPRMDLGNFYGLVKHARGKMGHIVDQIVYLSGVAPYDKSEASRREVREIRKFVVEAFLEMGYSKRQMRKGWSGLDSYATMAVDTDSGKVVVNHFDYSHLSESDED